MKTTHPKEIEAFCTYCGKRRDAKVLRFYKSENRAMSVSLQCKECDGVFVSGYKEEDAEMSQSDVLLENLKIDVDSFTMFGSPAKKQRPNIGFSVGLNSAAGLNAVKEMYKENPFISMILEKE